MLVYSLGNISSLHLTKSRRREIKFPNSWKFDRRLDSILVEQIQCYSVESYSFETSPDMKIRHLRVPGCHYCMSNPAITKKPMCSRPSDLSRACSACQIAVDIIHVSRNMNGRGGVSNHRRFHYLLNRLFRRRSKKTPTRRTASLCEGNSPVNSPHKGPVTRKMFPFDDVIMESVKVVGANLALNSIYVNITGCGTSHGIVRKGLTGIFKHMHIHLGGLFQQRINQCVNRSMWNVSISRRRGLLKQSTRLTSKSHSVMTVSWGLLGCRGPVLPTWFHLNPSLDK